jgi:L-aspartate oxidase
MSLVTRARECTGATFVGRDGAMQQVDAQRTLIATGGAGQVFRETTNPAIATGDGIAMAFDAGARVADLEFVQFHPTVLSVEGAPRFLLSEALRGEGARLINDAGEPFMSRYEPAGDLASRDLVARAIVKEVARTGAPVYLTMAHLDADYIRSRFPTIAQACRAAGLDIATDRVPVSPAAHYVMGGVESDLHGTHISGAAFCGRRGRLHRGARRQPAGEQFVAGRAGVRRACRRGDARCRCAGSAGGNTWRTDPRRAGLA